MRTRTDLPSPLLFAGAVGVALAALLGGDGGRVLLPAAGPQTVALEEGRGTLAPAAPLQERLAATARAPVDLGEGFLAFPSHAFALEALVLSRRAYRFDAEARVSPLDLTLGWGPMADPAVLADLSVTQSRRFGRIRTRQGATTDPGPLGPFWSNVHLIPADPAIAARLEEIGEGRVIRLAGRLVNVEGPGGWRW